MRGEDELYIGTQDGSACVKEKGNYYYIDTEGKQFTYGDYIEAYPFAESQGSFARVKTKAGKWSIIDRDENVIFEDFDSINELPYFSAVGSAVKDGKVVLFSLEYTDHMQSSVVCTLDEYTEIRMEPVSIYIMMNRSIDVNALDIWRKVW